MTGFRRAASRCCIAGAVAFAGTVVVGTRAPAPAAASTSSWTNSATTGPPAETGASMAFDQSTGTDVLFTTSGQTWTWNGTAWTQLNPSASPSPRSNATMGYDVARAEVVLFGGVSGSTTFNDTWVWNGTTATWIQRMPTNTPPWRGGASMAWDGKSGNLLMFGGFDSPTVFYNDTWEWDGGQWNEQLAARNSAANTMVSVGAVAPSPRTLAQMSEDTANQTIVLFGGTNPQGVLSDTWVWYDSFEGGRWIPVTPTQSPPARFNGGFGYASASAAQGPVMFGGSSGSSLLQDSWGWDGRGWTLLAPSGAPSARTGAATAAGPNGTTVLFGGTAAGGLQGDTWTWSGTIDAAPLATPTIASCPGVTEPLPTTTSGSGTLRGAAAASHPGLYIGAALTANQIYDADVEEQTTSASQFNLIASSNQMYWSAVEQQPGVFNFCDGDQFVAYAQANHQSLRLHNLIAGTESLGQTPMWVTSPDYPWTATSLSAVMEQWITTAINHYRGKVSVYDVANEAMDGFGNISVNVFQKTIGYPRYVEEAFQYAAAANPQGTLLYDDTADWSGTKLTKVESLLSDLSAAGDPAGAVGMEMFGVGNSVTSDDVAGGMSALASLGVKTAITQMMAPFNTVDPSGTALMTQSNIYKYVLQACLVPASNCFMLMTWSVSDTYTLPAAVLSTVVLDPKKVGTITFGGSLFDAAYQPRQAFGTVLSLLQ